MPDPHQPRTPPQPPAARTRGQDALSPTRRAWQRFRRNRLALGSAMLLSVWVSLLAVWPWFQHEPLRRHLPRALTWSPLALSEQQFAPPGAEHWFGTDVHGRDLLSRVVYGARISLVVGVLGGAVSVIVGVFWGGVAGYVGGRWDGWMMRVVDGLYAMPAIVLVVVLLASFQAQLRAEMIGRWGAGAGPMANLLLLLAGIGAVSWLTMARIVRAQVMALRERHYVAASRVLGATHIRILLRHVLPNVWGVVMAYVTLTIPSVILYESFLSYLGLGIEPPFASLGYLIADGAAHINALSSRWWLIVLPGLALTGSLLALNLVGDGLRDAWDAKLSRG